MPDTARTLAALQALLADNVAGDIGAQDVRDFLVSAWTPEHVRYLGHRLPDETAHADDDFFGSDSSADYTEQTPTGTGTWTIRRGGLSCVFDSQGADDLSAFLKPITVASAPMTIETRMRTFVPTIDAISMGLMFSDGVAAGSKSVALTTLGSDGSFIAGTFTFSRGTINAFVTENTDISPANGGLTGTYLTVYFRVIWTAANTWQAAYSFDGNAWINQGVGDTAYTMTPTHVGFGVSTRGALTDQAIAYDYLRVYDADLSV